MSQLAHLRGDSALAELLLDLQISDGPATVQAVRRHHLYDWNRQIDREAGDEPKRAKHRAALAARVALATHRLSRIGYGWLIFGNVYLALDQPKIALGPLLRGRRAFRRANRSDEALWIGLSIGWAYDSLGEYEQSIPYYWNLIKGYKQSEDIRHRTRIAQAYNNLGSAYLSLGYLMKALDCLDRSKRRWQRIDTPEAKIESADPLLNSGLVKILLCQYDEAYIALIRSRAIYAEHEKWRYVARADMDIAWLETLRQKSSTHIQEAFDVAYASRDRAGLNGDKDDNDDVELVFLDLLFARWLIRNGRQNEAQQLAERVYRRCTKYAAAAYEAAHARLLIADILLRSGNFEEAFSHYQDIVQTARQENHVELIISASTGKAHTHYLQHNIPAAIDDLTHLLAVVEDRRLRLPVDELRASFLDDKLKIYRELAWLYLRSGQSNALFIASERVKARTLSDRVVSASKRTRELGDDKKLRIAVLLERLQELRKQTESNPAIQMDAAYVDAKRREIVELMREIERHQSHLLGLHPEQLVTPQDVASQFVDADTVAVSYVAARNRLWAVLIDINGPIGKPVYIGRPPSPEEIRNGITDITSIVCWSPKMALSRLADEIVQAQRPLKEWHRRFIQPIYSTLSRYKRILFAPDGNLNSVPFFCLLDVESNKYLIENHELMVVPSLTTWSVIDPTAMQQPVSSVLSVGFPWGNLKRTVPEAKRVFDHFPASQVELLIDDKATRTEFMRLAPNADLIFVASHGKFDETNANFSHIVFADGHLVPSDIRALSLKAQSVILSACQTASGRLTGSDMLGLVHAFLGAGAQSVVASHWRVEDEATGDLMADLLAQAAKTGSMSKAVQTAMCAALSRKGNDPSKPSLTAHPFYWGAWTLLGRDASWIKKA